MRCNHKTERPVSETYVYYWSSVSPLFHDVFFYFVLNVLQWLWNRLSHLSVPPQWRHICISGDTYLVSVRTLMTDFNVYRFFYIHTVLFLYVSILPFIISVNCFTTTQTVDFVDDAFYMTALKLFPNTQRVSEIREVCSFQNKGVWREIWVSRSGDWRAVSSWMWHRVIWQNLPKFQRNLLQHQVECLLDLLFDFEYDHGVFLWNVCIFTRVHTTSKNRDSPRFAINGSSQVRNIFLTDFTLRCDLSPPYQGSAISLLLVG